MNDNAADSFRVIAHDDYGAPARCSYCPREVEHVVVVPLTRWPELKEAEGDDRWLGICAYCVLEMAKALERARISNA